MSTPPLASPPRPADPGGAARFDAPARDDLLPGAGPFRRADWFRTLWRERRATFAARVARDRGAVVFLGDSITQGWGDDLAGVFPGLHVANHGIGGDTSRGVLYRLVEDVLPLQPRGVVLLVGTNDLEEGAAVAVIAGNVRLMLQHLQNHAPGRPVLLNEVFPSSAGQQRPTSLIRALNAAFAPLPAEFPGVVLVHTWSVFAGPDGDARPSEFPDGLHPNESGYARWAKTLRPVLQAQQLLA